MHGLVIKNTGSWYTVLTDDGQELDCKLKGNYRIRKSAIRPTNPVAIGDRVTVEYPKVAPTSQSSGESAEGGGAASSTCPFITSVEDRRNYIIRRSQNLSRQCHILAANVDQAVLVVTVAHPETSTTFIDRFLASAEAYDVPVVLVFNKTDLLSPDELELQQYLIHVYSHIGYTCIPVSAIQVDTLAPLMPLLHNRVTLLSGNSGVGKSTLLNNIIPGLNIRTAPISEAHDTGQHTTTFSTMYRLQHQQGEKAFLIDTPGIKGFGTLDFQSAEVSHYFPEIFKISAECRFSNCTHTHEPGCAVLQALEDHLIAPSRYASYLSILQDEDEGKYRPAF
ncbi:MAG: ribosome small subunit-dependent GTPase A [Prevotella sp.]|nr:ribosome small subunit-dependent GTPase A [Prevotella sp.]